MQRYARPLEVFALQWTDEAEDCVQEAFFELINQPSAPDNVAAWLYRVVRNRAISKARSESRRRKREKTVAAGRSTWFVSTPETIDREDLQAAIEILPDRQREAVVARVWGGLSFEELSEALGVSLSSAHRHYTAGLQSLKAKLGAHV